MTDRIQMARWTAGGQPLTPEAAEQAGETARSVWQARVPRDLSRTLEKDMAVLGLTNRSEAVRRALVLLHQEAAEVRVEEEYQSWYGSERAPLSDVTAALYSDDE
jgi:hypothetical protein